MEKVISVNGPVEKIEGKLKLRIPLTVGGRELAAYCASISQIAGEYLTIVIQDWLPRNLVFQKAL